MSCHTIMALVQREDLLRWAREFVDDRILTMLWYPKHEPLTKLGEYLFFKDTYYG